MYAGKFNDLATAFMSNQDETIKHIFSLGRLSRKYEVCKDDNCYFTLQTLFILTITYWVFMVLLGGIVIPGGLFMPSIMVTVPLHINCSRTHASDIFSFPMSCLGAYKMRDYASNILCSCALHNTSLKCLLRNSPSCEPQDRHME